MARKKKKEAIPTRKIVAKWKDWKAGDMAWGKTFKVGKLVYGEIKEFHPDDGLGPSVTLVEAVNGSYIVILASTLMEKDPKKTRTKRKKKKREEK